MQTAPFRPEAVALRAGRLMLGEIADRVRRGSSFAFDAGLRKFHGRYRLLVDAWVLYDKGGTEPVLLASGKRHE